jgi:uncharacterized FlaG/YvyC family protein
MLNINKVAATQTNKEKLKKERCNMDWKKTKPQIEICVWKQKNPQNQNTSKQIFKMVKILHEHFDFTYEIKLWKES